MKHVVLLGGSIFDNGAYTLGGPPVVDQVKLALPAGARATLLAVDGNTASQARKQVHQVPSGATHLVLSIGGNNALGNLDKLGTPVGNLLAALVMLSAISATFKADYQELLADAMALGRPLVLCTIYDSVPGLLPGMKAALALFNDVILHCAIEHGLPVLDLRMVCLGAGDYSTKSSTVPSSQGGAKIALAMVDAIKEHDFSVIGCGVYYQLAGHGLMNHGLTVLGSAQHAGATNVMVAAWACVLDYGQTSLVTTAADLASRGPAYCDKFKAATLW